MAALVKLMKAMVALRVGLDGQGVDGIDGWLCDGACTACCGSFATGCMNAVRKLSAWHAACDCIRSATGSGQEGMVFRLAVRLGEKVEGPLAACVARSASPSVTGCKCFVTRPEWPAVCDIKGRVANAAMTLCPSVVNAAKPSTELSCMECSQSDVLCGG